MKYLYLTILVITILFTYGCKEEEYVYPPVYTEMMELQTDESGEVISFIIDNGQSYFISNASYFNVLVPDTLYRVIGIYELEEERNNTAYVYSLASVFSRHPIKQSNLIADIKTAPVDIESIWKSGGYINFSALVKVHSRSHTYHFIETEVKQEEDYKKVCIHFYHDRNEDVEGYTQRTYFSLPLKTYENILSPGDSICFSVTTYKEDIKKYLFPF